LILCRSEHMPIHEKQIARLAETRRTAIGRLLLMVRRDFVKRVVKRSREIGLVEFPDNLITLIPYIETEGTRNTELARRAGISKQAVAKTIKICETMGFLERAPDPVDGRATLIRLSPQGLEILVGMHRAIREVNRDYESLLGKDGMANFRGALITIINDRSSD